MQGKQPEVAERKGSLTVIALRSCEGGHRAIAGVVLPLLDADPHVAARIFLTCSART